MKTPTPATDMFRQFGPQLAEAFNEIISIAAAEALNQVRQGNFEAALIAAAIAGEIRTLSANIVNDLESFCQVSDKFFENFPEHIVGAQEGR